MKLRDWWWIGALAGMLILVGAAWAARPGAYSQTQPLPRLASDPDPARTVLRPRCRRAQRRARK